MAEITQDRVRELFKYNPETGILTWRERKQGRRPTVGGDNGFGYLRVCIAGKRHMVHIIIWLYVHGYMPSCEIDHRDLNKSNNRIKNLRLATASQNKANCKVYSNNKSGLKGAHYDKSRDQYRSILTKDYKKYFLGIFRTAQEAHDAFVKASKEMFGEFENH